MDVWKFWLLLYPPFKDVQFSGLAKGLVGQIILQSMFTMIQSFCKLPQDLTVVGMLEKGSKCFIFWEHLFFYCLPKYQFGFPCFPKSVS